MTTAILFPESTSAVRVARFDEDAPQAAFFSREDHLLANQPRVTLYACVHQHVRSPKYKGYIGDEKVSLFLRQPIGRAPFLSIVGALSGTRPNETLGTARVVTAQSGAPRLRLHLRYLGDMRVFASAARHIDHQTLVSLGLDEQMQQSKREAWMASRIEPVHAAAMMG